jgi:hypothetical protein
LKEIYNPTYQITFSIDNEKYVISIESRLSIELSSIVKKDELKTEFSFDQSLTKFRVTVSKILDNNYLRFEEYKEFNTFEDVKNYLLEWAKKIPSQ